MIDNKKYILFDLDGTLTDPKVGICTCAQYALKAFDIDEPDLDKLEPFIGPPLKDSFMQYYGLSEEQAEAAIEKYRERFSTVGKFENEIYPGIADMLVDLKNYGYRLAVASSKPEVFVKEILEHFHIAQYFDVIVGSELDGSRIDKAEVIAEALNRLFHYGRIYKDQIIMIGDRKFDVEGAKEMEVTSVAVGYGYGPAEELQKAEPDYIVNTVAELRNLLIDDEELKNRIEKNRQEAKEKEKGLIHLEAAKEKAAKNSPLSMVWNFLFPFLLFYFAGEFFRQAYGFVFSFLSDIIKPLYDFMFVAEDSNEVMLALSGNGNALIQMFSLLSVGFVLYKLGGGNTCLEENRANAKKFSGLEWSAWIAVTLLIATGLNMFISSIGWMEQSSGYQEAATNLYAVGVPMGLILYGICSPLVEELLFRGIIFTQVKRYMKPFGAALLSTMLFAIYHGNSVQAVYSFVLGFVLAFAYHYSGNLIVSIVLHGIVNAMVFLASNYGFFKGTLAQLIAGGVCIVIGAIFFFIIYKKYEKKMNSDERV